MIRIDRLAWVLTLILGGCTTVNNTQLSASSQQVASAPLPMTAFRPAGAPPGPAPSLAELGPGESLIHNQSYHGSFPFGGRKIPLPDGEWTAIGRGVSREHTTGQLQEIGVLERHQGTVVTGLIELVGNPVARPRDHGFPLDGACTRSDVITSDIRAAVPFGRQDCMFIDFNLSATMRGATGLPRSVVNDLDARNLSLPPVVIAAVFMLSDDRFRQVMVLMLNPDLSGVPQDPSVLRARSSWASYNLAKEPVRAAYVEHVHQWANGWRGLLQTAFAGHSVAVPAALSATP